MKILGVDNGYYGGLVMIDGSGHVLHQKAMPILTYYITGKNKRKETVQKVRHALEGKEIRDFIYKTNPDFVWVEKAQPFPQQGGVSNFSIGGSFHRIIGILEGLDIDHDFAPPRKWQKVMFAGMIKGDTKKMSYIACSRLWPEVDWHVNDKPHDGLTDAALIAEYGRRVLSGGGT